MTLIEQEVKIALEAESFARLKSGLGLDGVAPRQQVNHYYDSDQSALKAARAALRLRQYDQVSEWTFKQALDQFQALEITQTNAGRLDSVPGSLAAGCEPLSRLSQSRHRAPRLSSALWFSDTSLDSRLRLG